MIPLSLIIAIAYVESHGKPAAVGKHGELGILQISPAVIADCNRIQHTIRFTHTDALIPERAATMFRIWIGHYATPERFDYQDITPFLIARLWHGGPTGWRSAHTLDYGLRVANIASEYERNADSLRPLTDADWRRMFIRERSGLNANPLPAQIRAAMSAPMIVSP